jgi:hypothetical protein
MSLLTGIIGSSNALRFDNRFGDANGSWINGAPSVTASSGQIGDLCVALQFTRNNSSSGNTPNAPSGFTNLTTSGAGEGFSVRASYKIFTSNTETVTFPSYSDTAAGLLYIRPNKTITSVTEHSSNLQFTTSTPTAQTLTLSTATYPVFAIAFGFGTNNVNNVSTSPNLTYGQYLDVVNNDNLILYNYYNSSPGNVSVNLTDDGTNILGSFYLTAT